MTTRETLPSSCPLDCPDACSLDVTVEDGRVTKIDGSRINPLTDGFICAKVRRFARHLYGEARLLHPAVRVGPRGAGALREVSWDEALDRIAERLREARQRLGGETILPFYYGGSNGKLTQGSTDARLFRRLEASRLDTAICAKTAGRAAEGLYGKMLGVAPEDFVHARLIVVWGQNPSASSIHLVPKIHEARRRGAKLVVIDPRRTPLAKKADLHLALRPGTDLPLALALHHWLFENGAADRRFLAEHTTGSDALRRRAAAWPIERAAAEAGLAEADVEAFARLYAEGAPAVIRCGWGPERNRNGGSAVAAILALPAVAGKLGVRGGGYLMSNSGAVRLDDAALAAEPEAATRLINMNRLGSTLLDADDPPVTVLFVYNANPLATVPDQEKVRRGLERDDLFTVVFDQVMTDTARYADVVLPATTFLEHREVGRGYGAMVLQDARPVIAPVGEARTNPEVFAELLRRLDLDRDGEPESPDQLAEALYAASGVNGHRRALLERHGTAPIFETPPVQMVDVRPKTVDGKIHLLPEDLDRETPAGLYSYQADPASERFPLALISPATGKTVSSTFGQLDRRQIPLELDAGDAAARGIATGDEVRVWNELGEVRCRARIAHDLRPGVVFLPKGLWSHNTLNGRTANALAPATASDLAAGACFNDARVEVEKAPAADSPGPSPDRG